MFQGQNIQVFVRCRPLNTHEKRQVVVVPERREVRVLERNAVHDSRIFHFDQVFDPEARQSEVYDTVVRPLIDQVLLGFNCTVFAYGQTGTGKTYTMEGGRSNEAMPWEEDPQCGIIPRAISQLFEALKDQDNEFTVRVSFLELYNEDTYDLLSPLDDTTKLKIFDDAQRKGSVIVAGLEEIIVQSEAEIFEILKRGSAKRQTAATLLNACSSRSHTIFSVTIHIREGSAEGEELLKIGKLNLVDLAGSENIGRSGAQDKRAREAGNINQSLLTLGRVITALVEKGNSRHIPYRESKLTRLLRDSLGGKTKTSIIATVSPASIDLDDTLSTLDYASRAKKITNKPEMNQRLTKKALLREYTQEIERLRRDLQVTREKNGIYIEEENYKEMCKRASAGETHKKELEDRIIAVQSEMERQQQLFEEFTSRYEQTKAELDKYKEYCERQKKKISAQKAEKKHLATRAIQIIQSYETEKNDNQLLHGKNERLETIFQENKASIDRYLVKIGDDVSRIENLVEMSASNLSNSVGSFCDRVCSETQSARESIGELSQTNKSTSQRMITNSAKLKKLEEDFKLYKNSLKQADRNDLFAKECRKQSHNLMMRTSSLRDLADDFSNRATSLEKTNTVLGKGSSGSQTEDFIRHSYKELRDKLEAHSKFSRELESDLKERSQEYLKQAECHDNLAKDYKAKSNNILTKILETVLLSASDIEGAAATLTESSSSMEVLKEQLLNIEADSRQKVDDFDRMTSAMTSTTMREFGSLRNEFHVFFKHEYKEVAKTGLTPQKKDYDSSNRSFCNSFCERILEVNDISLCESTDPL